MFLTEERNLVSAEISQFGYYIYNSEACDISDEGVKILAQGSWPELLRLDLCITIAIKFIIRSSSLRG